MPQLPDVTLEAQGQLHDDQGRLQDALAAYQAALALRITRLGPDASESVRLLEKIGSAWYRLGRPAEALDAFEQALAGTQRQGDAAPLQVAELGAVVGTLHLELGQLEQARDRLTGALAQLEALVPAGNLTTGWVLFTLGRLEVRSARDPQARDALQRALDLYQRELGPVDPETAGVAEALGLTELRLRLTSQALQHLTGALEVYRKTYGPEHPATARQYAALAQLYSSAPPGIFDNLKALEFSRLYVQAFLTHQQAAFQTLDNEGKVRYNALAHRHFEQYFEAVFIERMVNETESQPHAQAAFDHWLTFKGSAYALENGLASLMSHADAGVRTQIESYLTLRREFAALSTAQPLTVADGARTAARLAELRAAMSRLEVQLSGGLGRYQDTVLPGRITAGDLRDVLQPGEVYLDYVWTDTNVFVFAYSREGRFDVQWLPVAGRLAEQYETLRKGAEAGLSLDALRPQATWLYDLLIRPVLPGLTGARSLVISPDGPLNFLPFELLSDGQQTVMERFVVRYIPSGRELLRQRRRVRTSAPEPAAVFGNPTFSAGVASGPPASAASRALALPSAAGVQSSSAAVATLARLLRGTVFSALPGTEAEARLVSGLLGTSTRVFLGADATDTNLFSLRSPRVLHVGTHGFFLGTSRESGLLPNPMLRSGLAFSGAQNAVNGGAGGGLLSGLQLAGLSLESTDLVVLSACETGLGDAVAGEGVAGLNQAFLTAGARQVMLSQWKVPDRETAALMADFYARYSGGLEAAEALRLAKLNLMRGGHPPGTGRRSSSLARDPTGELSFLRSQDPP
ncbi:CHAT domain-containing protein (plasmid) [Deinococcus taeanensis]|uniref:CHAT domain-containing protein n=1 Tax=Deinococcus taeanensis TaxID=2737050 RepID=UPI001CDD1BCB|nr:CHAT domain-containing tetratricopeptide repeat protein [Deinococcus taeanensis]UBV44123.1 CHAT domain-containing protein [Deinococcus taeanensis]